MNDEGQGALRPTTIVIVTLEEIIQTMPASNVII